MENNQDFNQEDTSVIPTSAESQANSGAVESRRNNKRSGSVGPWKMLSIALGILVVLLLTQSAVGLNGGGVSKEQASEQVGQLLQDTYGPLGVNITINDVQEEHGLYRVDFTLSPEGEESQNHEVYLTKDGERVIIQSATPDQIREQFNVLREMQEQAAEQQETENGTTDEQEVE